MAERLLTKKDVQLTYSLTKKQFNNNVSISDNMKYLRGIYGNVERFKNRYIDEMRKNVEKYFNLNTEETVDFHSQLQNLLDEYKSATRFSYMEAFNIKNNTFRSLVFGSISIAEMIKELGCERYKTDGIRLKMKQYDTYGNYLGTIEQDNVYEVHKVNGSKLGVEEELYVLKCWCTTTNKEHWLWIEEQYKDNPLEAVASTMRVHSNIIPFIKEIKRQGDVLLLEMKEDVNPEGEIVPLTKEQYFGLLTAQS